MFAETAETGGRIVTRLDIVGIGQQGDVGEQSTVQRSLDSF